MAVQKLSQIVTSPSNPIGADQFVGVHTGNTDFLFSLTQLIAGIGAAGGSSITINTTPILGGTPNAVLYDNAGTIGEASAFNIQSGQPNVPLAPTGQYLVGGAPGLAIDGHANVSLGQSGQTGTNTGGNNLSIGSNALNGIAIGDNQNVGVGNSAGTSLNGSQNVFIGALAGGAGVTATTNNNVLIGAVAGANVQGTGSHCLIGRGAGNNVSTGLGNTVIGCSDQFGDNAGSTITTGSQNIVIGMFCDVPNATANGQMSIQNIIYGTGNTQGGVNISTGWIGIGVKSAYGSEKFGVAGGIAVAGDPGSGAASTNTISNANSTTISTGVGSVRMSSANAATNTGWLKCYIGTQVAWIPTWTTNSP
jgi:hypothetical protein